MVRVFIKIYKAMGTSVWLAIAMAFVSIAYLGYAALKTELKSGEFEIEFVWKLINAGTIAGVPIVFALALLSNEGYVSGFAPGIYLACSVFAFAAFAIETMVCRRAYLSRLKSRNFEVDFKRWRLAIRIIAFSGFLFLSLATLMLVLNMSALELSFDKIEQLYISVLGYYSLTYLALSASTKLYAVKVKRVNANVL